MAMKTVRRLTGIMMAAATVLGLAACGKKPVPVPSPPETFSASAVVLQGEERREAAIEQAGPGQLTLAFSAPAELAGLVWSIDGTKTTLRYGDLTHGLSTAGLPAAGAAPLLLEALRQLRESPALASPKRDGSWESGGRAGGYAYTARQEPDGRLRCLAVPALDLTIEMTYGE
ncbi:MAG: hypothetical protein LBJ11_07930 [Oscillospiraceae bacterium]|jgi:predicted small lipoprotein YifL|nr:hypothetical protein [Oscillospiraceae bacterium]